MMTWKDVYYYFFKCVSFKNVVRKETAGYSNGGIATSIERPPLLTDSPIKTARKPHNKGELCYGNRQTDRQTEEVSVASAGSLKCNIQKTRAGNILGNGRVKFNLNVPCVTFFSNHFQIVCGPIYYRPIRIYAFCWHS
jgi:hypothetical protein